MAILGLAGAVAAAISLDGSASSEREAEVRPPTPTATAPTSPASRGPEVVKGHFPHKAYGDRLNFGVDNLGTTDDECTVNAFQYLGIGTDSGAYYSACSDWESAGSDLYLFQVSFYNKSDARTSLRRGSFSLLDRRGERHRAIDVRKEALFPKFFIARREYVKPSEQVDGWLVFDGDPDFVPKTLSYRDGDEILTVVFEGELRRFSPR